MSGGDAPLFYAQERMNQKLLQLIIQLKDEASAGLASLSSTLGSVGGVLKGVFTAAVIGAGVAIAGLAAGSLSVAADFQAASATFASVAGGSLAQAGFQLEDVTQKALEMGAQTQFSAAQAQEAMINLAKGGVPIVDIMGEATQATLDLAAAGEVELGPAADIVAKQLGIWASTGTTAADVANTLAQAANASTVDVEELALGLANVGGVAKVSGVSFQDLNQTMAMIAPGFSSAADAGTSLKTFFLALQPTTANAAGTMQQLGLITTDYAAIADDLGVSLDGSAASHAHLQDAINATVSAQSGAAIGTKEFDSAMTAFLADFEVNKFYDATGAFVGMDQASGLLHDSLQGLSEAEQSAALKAIFGTDAFRAAALIAEQGAPGFQAMGAAMDAAGTAAEQAAIRNATFKFAWDSLLGTIETIQIVIGSALLPVLTSLINDAIIPGANAVLAFGQAMVTASDPLAFLVAAIDSVLPGFQAFADFVSANAIPILAGFAAMILAVVIPAFIAWASAATASAIATTIALAPIVIPILAIGAAVALLAAAWQNNWGGIQEKTAAVWAFIQPAFDQLVAWLSVAIPAAIQAAAQLWTTVLWPALQTVGNFIVSTVIPALSQVATWLATNVPAAIAAAVAAFNSIASVVSSVFATVSSAVSTGVSTIQTVMQAGWNTVVFLTTAAWNAVAGVVGPAIAQVVAVVGPAIAQVQAVWSAGLTVVQSVTSSVWATIQSVVAAAVAAVQSVIQSVIGFIQSVWGGAQQAAQSQTSAAWSAIQTLITGAMLAVRVAIQTGVAVVQTIMKTAWAVVVAAAQNDFGKIPAIIQAGWERVKGIMQAGVSAITSIAGTMAAAAVSLGKNIVSGIISGVGSMAGALGEKLKSMANSALSAAKSALGIHSPSTVMAQQIGMPIIDGIVMGLGAGAPKVTAKMLELAGQMVDLVSKGVDAFGKLRDLGSISFGAIASFTNTMQQAMTLFAEMALQWDKAMMSAASQFARKSGEITDAMVKGVDFLLKLQQYEGVAPAVITAFANNLGLAMTELIRISTRELRIGMAAAVEFSLGAGKILDILSKGVEGLNKLRTLAAPIPGSFKLFADQVVWLVFRMAEVAGQIDASAVAAAGRFAEGAGKVIGILGSGVDGLTKLGTLGAPVPGAFQNFANQVLWLVFRISEVAGQISQQAVAAAATFAEGAGKVIAIIGSGVDGFAKLAAFAGVPGPAFLLFQDTVFTIVVIIAHMATLFAVEAVAAAAVFAEGVGKVLGIIASGVAGLKALADLGPVSQDAMRNFAVAINVLLLHLASIATQFSAESITAASAFADAAGKAVGILKTGVDGFLAVDTFTGVSEAALTRFADGVRLTVAIMVRLAVEFGSEAVAAAAAFANAAGQSTDFLKKGVEGFVKLADLKEVPLAALNLFASAVVALVQTIIQLSTVVTTDVLAQAIRFANGMDQVITVVMGALQAIAKLGTDAAAVPGFVAAFTASVAKIVADFAGQVVPPATTVGANISVSIANGITSGIPAVQTAATAAVGAAVALLNSYAGQVVAPAQNIGTNISIGIANGIGAGIPAIQNAVNAAVNAALAAAYAALGIASPSRVFDELVGQQAGAGLAQGLDASVGTVAASADNLASAAITPAVAAVGSRAAAPAGAPVGAGGGGGGLAGGNLYVTINQQPGESAEALLNKMIPLLERKLGLKVR